MGFQKIVQKYEILSYEYTLCCKKFKVLQNIGF